MMWSLADRCSARTAARVSLTTDGRSAFIPLRECAARRIDLKVSVACGNRRRDRDAPRSRPFGTSCNLESCAEELLRVRNIGCRRFDARKRADTAKAVLNDRDTFAGFSNFDP
jgi:hypothetical protein